MRIANTGRALRASGTRLAPTEAERRLAGARSAEQSVAFMRSGACASRHVSLLYRKLRSYRVRAPFLYKIKISLEKKPLVIL